MTYVPNKWITYVLTGRKEGKGEEKLDEGEEVQRHQLFFPVGKAPAKGEEKEDSPLVRRKAPMTSCN